MDFYGYTGKILNVDLTNNKIYVENEKVEDLIQFTHGVPGGTDGWIGLVKNNPYYQF